MGRCLGAGTYLQHGLCPGFLRFKEPGRRPVAWAGGGGRGEAGCHGGQESLLWTPHKPEPLAPGWNPGHLIPGWPGKHQACQEWAQLSAWPPAPLSSPPAAAGFREGMRMVRQRAVGKAAVSSACSRCCDKLPLRHPAIQPSSHPGEPLPNCHPNEWLTAPLCTGNDEHLLWAPSCSKHFPTFPLCQAPSSVGGASFLQKPCGSLARHRLGVPPRRAWTCPESSLLPQSLCLSQGKLSYWSHCGQRMG